MLLPIPVPFNQRLGFHYYPDTLHYRQDDLETCLPVLQRMGAAWVTLLAPAERAIPESFLGGLLAAGIRPVLHFAALSPGVPPPVGELQPLLHSYARWGVQYVAFFDRPNRRASWAPGAWVQGDLVERFLDGYTPLAALAAADGLIPVFPPLEPGGDYWDLAFLRSALAALLRRAGPGDPLGRQSFALGAYAWAGKHPLDWGAGGPRRWPGLRPYQTQPGMQDQQGLRIFDWYLDIAQAELGFRPPVLLLRTGYRGSGVGAPETAQADRLWHARLNLAIARSLAGETDGATGYTLPPIPPEVLACNFWLLAAEVDQPEAGDAWLGRQGQALPVVEAFARWVAYRRKQEQQVLQGAAIIRKWAGSQPDLDCCPQEHSLAREAAPGCDPQETSVQAGTTSPDLLSELRWAFEDEHTLTPDWPPAGADGAENAPDGSQAAPRRPISHYVLLPVYAWGAANWDLALVEPLLQDSHPTIGFSLAEARHAERVTVVGGEGAISAEALDMLRQSGCQVERILEDGTFVATGAVYPQENNL